MDDTRVTRALGVFSIGLGLADLVTPGSLGELIGVGDGPRSRTALRIVGAREIACGVGILTQRRPTGWVWGRVAGDAMDLSLTSAALASDAPRKDRVLGTLAALLGIAAADLYVAIRLSRTSAADRAIDVKRAVTVLQSPEEAYRYWRDFTNLPRFMEHLESVQVLGSNRSHWKVKAPAGAAVEWDAEIETDRPNHLIAWRSLPGASVANSGTVRFVPAPGGRGTEIHVEMRYDPPGGRLGTIVAKLFGEEPAQQVRDDLGRFKQILETGQVTLSDATAKGRGAAQPPEMAPPAESTRRADVTREPEPTLR